MKFLQTVVAHSSTKSEYHALSSAASELLWIQHLLSAISVKLQSHPPLLWYDYLGAQALAMNTVHHAQTNHIDLDVHFIRDLTAEGKLGVRFVLNEEQPNDVFTKPLRLDHFRSFFRKLVQDFPCNLKGHVDHNTLPVENILQRAEDM